MSAAPTEPATMKNKPWKFEHNQQQQASWVQGLRNIFEYRDLGISAATGGDYVAHLIRTKETGGDDDVKQWHQHHCTFQMVYMLKGWARFEYEGLGVRTLRAGDCINQLPMIKHREIDCSEDMELLEIVAPADFKTTVVADQMQSGANPAER